VSTPEDRAWEIVRRAFEERTPAPRRTVHRAALAALVVVMAAVVGAALSAPGRAVFQRVREAVGVENAAPAIFALPGGGRLLVVSTGSGDVWTVDAHGLKRRLGRYADAEWSPHGLYVVATRGDELVALDPAGRIRWSLARRGAELPRWEGTLTDTRIAYLAADGLRVVAGDGTGDHLLDAHAGRVAPAWDPALLHTLAYAVRAAIVLRRGDGALVWRSAVGATPTSLAWSSDGRYLAAVTPRRVIVLDSHGRVARTVSMLGAALRQAAFRPDTHDLAVVVARGSRSEIRVVDVDRPGHARLLFAGPGTFGDVAWSPHGGWLLVNWPVANQWVFIRGGRVRAVANIRQEFAAGAGRTTPRLELAGRWCCTARG